VRNLIAKHFVDLTHLLGRLAAPSRDFHWSLLARHSIVSPNWQQHRSAMALSRPIERPCLYRPLRQHEGYVPNVKQDWSKFGIWIVGWDLENTATASQKFAITHRQPWWQMLQAFNTSAVPVLWQRPSLLQNSCASAWFEASVMYWNELERPLIQLNRFPAVGCLRLRLTSNAAKQRGCERHLDIQHICLCSYWRKSALAILKFNSFSFTYRAVPWIGHGITYCEGSGSLEGQ